MPANLKQSTEVISPPSLKRNDSGPFAFVFSVEYRHLGSVGAKMTPGGILNAKWSQYAAAPPPPENIIC